MPVSQWRKLRDRILKRDEHRCYICGRDGADEVDHIIPLFEGGSKADPGNLAAIHDDPCHQAKSKGEAARANARRKNRS
jgi:5-methylcytosine-specific restriction endonuclease McrA